MKRADEGQQLSASVSPADASRSSSVGPQLSNRARIRRLRQQEVRQESPSPFKDILDRLMRSVPGALGAIVVDSEGEAVDFAGSLPSFHTKLIGAHLRVALDACRPAGDVSPRQLTVRAAGATFLVRALPEGYALALALARGAFDVSERALAHAEWELAVEAGWSPHLSRPSWYRAEVEGAARNRFRPERVRWGSEWEALDVLGIVVGLQRERGYRCRLRSGVELTLLREPAGTWYADESPPRGESRSSLDSRSAKA